LPLSIVFFSDLKTALGSVACITAWLKTFTPNKALAGVSAKFNGAEIGL
jgi:hypothetical protein